MESEIKLLQIFSVRTPEKSTSFKELHCSHATSMLHNQITLIQKSEMDFQHFNNFPNDMHFECYTTK